MIICAIKQDETAILYNKYIYECVRTRDFTIFREAELDEGVKEVWNFIKELASSAALKINDLVRALKNKKIFTFFAAFKFNPKNIAAAFKGVYTFAKKIAHFIPGNITKFLQKGYTAIPEEHRKTIINGIISMDKWVRSQGNFGKLLFGCFLVWVWIQAGLTGNVSYDFDISEPLDAFRGKLTVAEFFLGKNMDGTTWDDDDPSKKTKPSGALEYLGLIIAGNLGVGGILPYAKFSNSIFLTVSIIQYLAKELLGKKISTGRNTDKDMDKAAAAFA